MRVLVTGSRDWTDELIIRSQLNRLFAEVVAIGESMVVVHGGARGADSIAANWVFDTLTYAALDGYPESVSHERWDADWGRWGKRAGIIRNEQMVKAGADICLAFIRNNSPGATHCASAAANAGIATVTFRA